ncbi:MAG: PAS domain-containing protein [Deltaproteobacteria bacterium]|nr:PAS domain-containing protein [Deltaproteobacteria bacterium]
MAHHLIDVFPVDEMTSVHNEGIAREKVVHTKDHRQYLMRILPYRIGPEAYFGVLATFVDLTALQHATHSLMDVRWNTDRNTVDSECCAVRNSDF